MAVENLTRHKSPSVDQIRAELIKADGRAIRSEIRKLINSIWDKEELPEEYNESLYLSIRRAIKQIVIIVEISSFADILQILSNVLLSRLTPYAEEFIGDHQCGLRRNRSTTDHIFCSCQILEKKLEYNKAVYHLFIDF
jgi:hypothetical protein